MSVRLFVGNLAYDVTEAELRELFSRAGTPTQVRLPTDRETGKPRGFAFVDFADQGQAEEAVRLFNQQMFKGRTLAVNEARAREDRSASGRPTGPARPPQSSVASQPAWSGEPAPSEDDRSPGQPRRTFGPDARARDKRKRNGRGSGSREERAPKRRLREVGGGQLFLGADPDDDHDDAGLDNFALWAQEDGKKRDED